ncbi:MAG: glycosyltransferase family 9 protein [Alphaproteobacteria bacterium]
MTKQGTGQRTLVLFPGALGDFICFLPALRVLAQAAFVDLLARSEFADLVPETVQVRSLDRYEVNRLFVAGAGNEDKVAGFFAGYDSTYAWMGSGQNLFVRQLQNLCQGRAHIFSFDSAATERHQSEYYLSCLGVAASESLIPTIPLKPQAKAWSADFWARHSFEGRPVLILAPGSGAREKNWPVASFAAVAEWWREQEEGEPLVVLGPVEEERGGFEPLVRQYTAARNLTLAELAAIMVRGDLYLGNDSGVTHLAAALGIPTVALFGPSDVKKWRPQGKQVQVINRVLQCSPCVIAVMKNCGHRSCLYALEAAEVIQRLRAMVPGSRLDKVGGRD